MLQHSLFPPQSLTVSEITRYLRELFESDEILREVWVQGEVSNLSRPASGHIYFTLKDQGAALKCVIWKQTAWRIPLTLQNGMAIEAHGAIGVYDRDGQYQLYADAVRLTGEGALYQEYLRLKARLEAEGLFATERKRSLPEMPAAIGVVTSATGAALQDILYTLRRRFPLVEVVLAPVSVQGEEAPPQIVDAIRRLNLEPGIDLILVARGGGSLEDLWAFNDERVVRAIANSELPVITGIGHETDFTLSDFAADVRAATPTAAAEQAVPDRAELREQFVTVSSLLASDWQQRYNQERGLLVDAGRRLEMQSPAWRVRNDRQRHGLDILLECATGLRKRVVSLGPASVLKRGYAIVRTAQGELVTSVHQVQREDVLELRVTDGSILSQVLTEPTKDINGGNSDD
jgi:exodeoxyribonuclease VII large subunit